jgi:hypothetical protein
LSLIPIASEKNTTVRSGPVETEEGDEGDCRGQSFGIGGTFGTDCSAYEIIGSITCVRLR